MKTVKNNIKKMLEDMLMGKDVDAISDLLKTDKKTAKEIAISIAVKTIILLKPTTIQAIMIYTLDSLKNNTKITEKEIYAVIDYMAGNDVLKTNILVPKNNTKQYFMIYNSLSKQLDEDAILSIEGIEHPYPEAVEATEWKHTNFGGFKSYMNQSHISGNQRLNEGIDLEYYASVNKLQKVAYQLEDRMLDKVSYPTDKSTGYCKLKSTLRCADEMLKQGNKFYFQIKRDRNGRMYRTAYQLNPQGSTSDKVLIKFANEQMLTERGLHWLGVAIAGVYGLDKKTFQQRSMWFSRNKHSLIKNHKRWISKAKDPLFMEYYLLALRDHMDGKPTGVIMHLDHSASAFQIYALLYSCKETAKLVNLASGNKIENIQQIISDNINSKFNIDTFTRDVVKSIFSPISYCAGIKLIQNILMDELKNDYSDEIAEYAFDTVLNLSKSVGEGMNDIRSLYSDKKRYHTWALPNGVKCIRPSKITEEVTIDTEAFGSLTHYREVVGATRRSTGLASSVIHSVEAYWLSEVCMMSQFDLSTNHDDYGVHPNNCDKLISNVKDVACKINDSNLLSDVLSMISGKRIDVLKENTLRNEEIRKSLHMVN